MDDGQMDGAQYEWIDGIKSTQIILYNTSSMPQNMVLTWGPPCDFIFLEWKTTQWPEFWVGVGLTFLTCFLTTAYGPIFRKQIKNQSKSKLGTTFGYLIEYLLKLYVMLLMMTMNAHVCIAIAVGIALGYSVFSAWGDTIRRKLFPKSQNF